MRVLLRRKFCKCGCGQQIVSKKKGVEFVWGHHNKCLSDEVIQRRANSIRKSYEHRDGYWKGKRRSPESVMKTAEANRGRKYKKRSLLRRKMCACGCNKLFFSKRKEVMCIKGHVSPETRKKLSLVHIGSFKKGRVPWNKGLKSPETSERNKQRWKDPEYKDYMVNVLVTASKEKWKDPEYREHQSRVHKGYVHSKEHRRKIGEGVKNSPIYREVGLAKMSSGMKERWKDINYREKICKSRKEMWHNNPERRKKASQTIKNTIARVGVDQWIKNAQSKLTPEIISKNSKEMWAKRTPEGKAIIINAMHSALTSEIISKNSKEMWANRSLEERKIIGNKISLGQDREAMGITSKKRWENPEYRERKIKNMIEVWARRTPEEMDEIRSKMSCGIKLAYESDPEYGKKISKFHSERWANMSPERKQETIDKMLSWLPGTIGSSIEQKITNEAKKNGFVFYNNHRIGKYFADLYFPNYKMVVECDGKYWHGLPSAWMRDGRRDFWFRNNGYGVIRLKEDEINKDPEIAFNKVIKAISLGENA